ncbi:hypothetical protein N7G274_008928 [Stereocaulon virgatum]|uniref:Uncharacterized protein n=1 Tax=Stereocaulon virgatum TaxID=373712 RepID=A0ABR3ZX87_9LECA
MKKGIHTKKQQLPNVQHLCKETPPTFQAKQKSTIDYKDLRTSKGQGSNLRTLQVVNDCDFSIPATKTWGRKGAANDGCVCPSSMGPWDNVETPDILIDSD